MADSLALLAEAPARAGFATAVMRAVMLGPMCAGIMSGMPTEKITDSVLNRSEIDVAERSWAR